MQTGRIRLAWRQAAGPERARELAGVLLAGTALFLLTSLATFHVDYPAAGPATNLCGRIGYGIGYAGLSPVGAAAWVMMVLMAGWAGVAFTRTDGTGVLPRAVGSMVLLVALATALDGIFPLDGPAGASSSSVRLPMGAGGWIGSLVSPVLQSGFGPFGSWIVLAVASILALPLATDWGFQALIGGVAGRLGVLRDRMGEAEKSLARRAAQPKGESKTSAESKVSAVAEKARSVVKPKKAPAGAKSKAASPRLPFPGADDVLPPMDLLEKGTPAGKGFEKELRSRAREIEETLRAFGVDGEVVQHTHGPAVTLFEVKTPPGTKINRLSGVAGELAMALTVSSVRVVAPLPGRSTIGIEVPNDLRETVALRDLLEETVAERARMGLPISLARDVEGAVVFEDLAAMPHLLIAGSTGSGKSVCINSILLSLLMSRTPDELRLILVDPKMVELQPYKNLPHLLCPVVTNAKKAPAILEWLCRDMDRRYELLSAAGVKNIVSYNELGEEKAKRRLKQNGWDETELAQVPGQLPYTVVVVDELADLMMTAGREVETAVTRLAQKSRAVGIHMILATQRPSTNVITGLIKGNLPTRLAFMVASKVDSRVILDRNGADALLGKGDCLYMPPGSPDLNRAQGAIVNDREIRNVVEHWKGNAYQTEHHQELIQVKSVGDPGGDKADDPFFEEAVRVILENQRGSATLLQRALQIGYTRASRLIDQMGERGIVGDFRGSKSRKVLLTLEEWEKQSATGGAEAANEQ